MKKYFLLCLICAVGKNFSQVKTGEQLIGKMWKAGFMKTAKTVSFVQTTKIYSGDTVSKTSTWYEKIKYPDKFRIDFDSFPSSRISIFRNDSQFVIKKGEVIKKQEDKNELLLILGGMYFRKLPEVFKRLKESGFDLSVPGDTVFENIPYYITGKKETNQLWVQKDPLRVKRIILRDKGIVSMDALVEEWARSGNGWMEKKISFYKDGKKLQAEEYNMIQLDQNIDNKLFDPYGQKTK